MWQRPARHRWLLSAHPFLTPGDSVSDRRQDDPGPVVPSESMCHGSAGPSLAPGGAGMPGGEVTSWCLLTGFFRNRTTRINLLHPSPCITAIPPHPLSDAALDKRSRSLPAPCGSAHPFAARTPSRRAAPVGADLDLRRTARRRRRARGHGRDQFGSCSTQVLRKSASGSDSS